MPVIINDLEVVVDQAPPAEDNQAETPEPREDLSPQTVAAIARQFEDRLDRVRAH